MITVKAQGVTIDVAPETVRSKMNRAVLIRKIDGWKDTIADSLGYGADILLGPLMDFVYLGVRCKIVSGELDFNFPSHTATIEDVTSDFAAYMDSEYMPLMEELINAVNKLDTPHNPDFTAGELPESVEKKDKTHELISS